MVQRPRRQKRQHGAPKLHKRVRRKQELTSDRRKDSFPEAASPCTSSDIGRPAASLPPLPPHILSWEISKRACSSGRATFKCRRVCGWGSGYMSTTVRNTVRSDTAPTSADSYSALLHLDVQGLDINLRPWSSSEVSWSASLVPNSKPAPGCLVSTP